LNDFDRAWQHLEPAVVQWGEHTRESVLAAIASGQARLWAGNRSAAVTSVRSCPSGLRIANAWLAGGDLNELAEWEAPMVEWATAKGCGEARLFGRRGFLRALPGFTEIGTVMRRQL
jgi:hypothetical protein